MRRTEVLLNQNQQQKQLNVIPRPVAIIGGTLLILNALNLGVWGFGVLGGVFSVSTPVGLIMLFTAVGFLPFAPLWLGIVSLTWFEHIPTYVGKGEYWAKTVLCFAAGILSPYLLYMITTFTTLIIAATISNFIG
jgi:hypothetical protein